MSSDLFINLITKGYFPQEIVPWFNTDKLISIKEIILSNIDTYSSPRVSKPCKYSMPKGKHARRNLSIPNPYHQFKLCKIISEHWSEIRDIISYSKMSLTIPSIKAKSHRALSRKFSFSEISEKILVSSSSSRYMLKTDISRYYSTIYTHSIPWAIHTKETAKSKKRDMSLLGNKLDSAVQGCQDGQTNGIPIGPDTSLIISELLCSVLDKEVHNRIRYKNAFRYIDDYFMFFDSYADAEKAFFELHKIIREYELELNQYKTKIIELPSQIEPAWVSELNSSIKTQRELLSYISKVFDFSKKYPEDEVLKYSLSRMKKIRFSSGRIKVIIPFILSTIMHEPSVIPLAAEMLMAAKRESGAIITTQIREAIKEALLFNANLGYEFELSWLMWLCFTLNITINKEIAVKISKIDNSVIALMALYLKEKSIIPEGLDTTMWKSFMNAEELYDENWLLAYEAYIKGWLPSASGADYVSSDPFFRLLKENRIEFFNINAVIEWEHKSIDDKWLYNEFSSAF